MIYVVISLTALAASFLTFFSGFGLGTILMPVFALFVNLPTAIALTAIVHLLNNVFKLALVYKSINYKLALKFGVPALVASFAGASLLNLINGEHLELFAYQLAEKNFIINWQGLLIGFVVFIFSIVELNPKLSNLSFSTNWIIPGGILTGFFGGLSGHQGALRSAFMLRLNLEKTTFIATGVAIACMVDVARLSIYSYNFKTLSDNYLILVVAIVSAFSGAIIGNKVFKKTSINFLKYTVGIFMLIVSLLMMSGIINK